jgi:hypothetical protein
MLFFEHFPSMPKPFTVGGANDIRHMLLIGHGSIATSDHQHLLDGRNFEGAKMGARLIIPSPSTLQKANVVDMNEWN